MSTFNHTSRAVVSPVAEHATREAVCPALSAVGLRPGSGSANGCDSGRTLPPEPQQVRAFRYGLASAGVGCVGLAAVGAVVPGMPTTVFLIMATWCFTRSCPWLSEKLIHNRFFAPFVKYLGPGTVMPRRAKVIAAAMMWTAIAVSCGLLAMREAPVWILAAVVASGGVGTWCIVRQGRRARSHRA